MDSLFPLKAAHHSLDDARRHVESGTDIASICNDIATAMYWAMEHWVRWQGHRPDFGNGWHSLHTQFVGLAEEMPVGALSRCVHEANRLHLCLYRDDLPGCSRERWDLGAWKRDVGRCLMDAERLMGILPIPPECPGVFRFRLSAAGSPYLEVRWRRGRLFYLSSPVERGKRRPIPVLPDAREWRRFWQAADRMRLWNWPRRHPGQGPEEGGVRWALHVVHGTRIVRSGGTDGNPFAPGITSSPELGALVEAIGVLVGRPLTK